MGPRCIYPNTHPKQFALFSTQSENGYWWLIIPVLFFGAKLSLNFSQVSSLSVVLLGICRFNFWNKLSNCFPVGLYQAFFEGEFLSFFFHFLGTDSFPGCFWTIQKSFRAKDAAVHHNTGPEALQGTPHANLSFLASQGHCFIGSDSTYISVKGRWEKLLHPFRRHYAQRSLNPDLGMGPGMPRGV